jgi:hypothetical protein
MGAIRVDTLGSSSVGMDIIYEKINLGKLSKIEQLTMMADGNQTGTNAGNMFELTFENGTRKHIAGNKTVMVENPKYLTAPPAKGGLRKKRRSSKRRSSKRRSSKRRSSKRRTRRF